MSGDGSALLPLALGVARREAAGGAAPRALDPDGFAALRAQVFERDGYACRFCGFVSRKYHEVAWLNADPFDQRQDNAATACVFCQQARNLQAVAPMRSGSLVWLPEIGQAALNTICRAIYIARITSGPMADAAREALDALMARRDGAKVRLGTDDPGVLAAVLQDFLEDHEYADRIRKLDGIRLLPHDRRVIREADLEFNQFPQILAYWRSKDGPFGGVMPPSWFDLFDQVNGGLGGEPAPAPAAGAA